MALPADLLAAFEAFCAQPVVLVASDFDGVLAPFVTDPMAARALDGTVEDLAALSTLPDTYAAVVSGRDLEVLTGLTGLGSLEGGGAVTRIGSHGAQSSRSDAAPDALTPEQRALLERLTADLREVAKTHPGVRLEHKPKATVLHTRGEDREVAEAAVRSALELAERHTGVRVLEGKDVVELSVVTADKGTALTALKAEVGADVVAYFGDDVTDEHVFAVLGSGDVGVKIGPGATAAGFRLERIEQVGEALRALRTLREDASAGG